MLRVGLLTVVALAVTACAPAPLSGSALTGVSPAGSTSGAPPTTGPPGPTGPTGPTPTVPTVPAAPAGSTETPGPTVTTLPSSSGSPAATTRPVPPPTTRSTPVLTGSSSPTVVDATGHVETAFATAAGGIVCAVSADGPQARCDLESSTWTPPPTPPDCHGAWGAGISLTARGAELTCTTDTVLADAARGGAGTWWEGLPASRLVSRASGQQEVTLATGAAVVAGSGSSRLTCRSDSTTVTCTLGSGRFSVSRQAYSLR